jgi:tRNA A37 threonylcarbamoyltransferase TsaD
MFEGICMTGGQLDNAVMIAWGSMERFHAHNIDSYDIDLLPKWDLASLRKAEESRLFGDHS